MLEPLDLAAFRRDERALRSRLLERLTRTGELDLLDSIGSENSDAFPFEIGCHLPLLSRKRVAMNEHSAIAHCAEAARLSGLDKHPSLRCAPSHCALLLSPIRY